MICEMTILKIETPKELEELAGVADLVSDSIRFCAMGGIWRVSTTFGMWGVDDIARKYLWE